MSAEPQTQIARKLEVPPTPAASEGGNEGVLFGDADLKPAVRRACRPLPPEQLKLRTPQRNQLGWLPVNLEESIPPDHKARAIWDLTEKADLSEFYQAVRTVKGQAGGWAWDARLLVALWLYALSEGIGAAREIERMMAYEPGLRWLSGGKVINYHTLSSFRTAHGEGLNKLFCQLLVTLEGEGLVRLDLIAHDGMKVAAQAGVDTFRREPAVRAKLEQARERYAKLLAGQGSQENPRRQVAQLKAARERQERLQQALAEFEAVRAEKKTAEEKAQARVSISDPEARIMMKSDHGFGPAYNTQISTDAEQKVIVGVEVTQCSSDSPSLMGALDQVEENLELPRQAVVDAGYTSAENIVGAAEKKVDLIGSLRDRDQRSADAMKSSGIDAGFAPKNFVPIGGAAADAEAVCCPGGKTLPYVRPSTKHGDRYRQYQAAASDCAACPFRPQCCGKKNKTEGRTVSVRVEENPQVVAFREKMAQSEAQQIYKRRGEVAEFPNAWIKDKIGLRKFRLRGLAKVKIEATWACLTYNVMAWVRLVWRPKLAAAV